LGNMIFLFVFGNAVNAKLGHFWFLGAYFLLGAFAGLGWLLLGKGLPMIGASGAIMGIVGMFLILFPRNEVRVFYWITWYWMGSFTIASGAVIGFYMVCDLLGTLFGGGGAIAYIAHLTGAAGGMALAIGLLSSRLIRSESYEENMLQLLGWRPKKRRRKKVQAEEERPRVKRARPQ